MKISRGIIPSINKYDAFKQTTINETLANYEEKSINFVIESLGGVYEGGRWNLNAVPEKIPIERFYHLPIPLREKIIKHALGNRVTAWQLWLQEEHMKIPIYQRSPHEFPREYQLKYMMGDKSRDVIMTELINYGEKTTKRQIPTKKKRISVTLKRLVWNQTFGETIGSADCKRLRIFCAVSRIVISCGFPRLIGPINESISMTLTSPSIRSDT